MKRLAHRLLPLLLAAAMLCPAVSAAGPAVYAAELSDGLLQSGGLLTAFAAAEGDRALPQGTGAQDPHAAAKETILAGLLAMAEEIDVSAYGFSANEGTAFDVYRSVINAHPELFYVSAQVRYSLSGSTILTLFPIYDESFTEEDVTRFRTVCDGILAQLEPEWSPLRKALWLHDYLVTHCEYDLTYSNYDAYDALVTRSAVCQGYALAFEYLCNRAELDARLVTSDVLNHAWNLIALDGEYFYVDCTWDDPSNRWYEGYCGHANFLRSQAGLVETGHDADDDGNAATDWICDGSLVYGVLESSDRYDGAWWADLITAVAQRGGTAAYARRSDGANVWLRDMDSGTETAVPLAASAAWPVWDQPGYYWNGNYASFAALRGDFYFTTPTAIYRLDTNGSTESVYTLTAEEQGSGYLYGLVADEGRLYYNLGTQAWNTTFTRTELPIAPAGPTITRQPVNYVGELGSAASFTVAAEGEELTYQWQVGGGKTWKDSTAAGARTATLRPGAVTEARLAYRYRCIITDKYGSSVTTDTVKMVKRMPLAITTQPEDYVGELGSTAKFTVVAEGEELTYQWQVGGGKTWKDSGAAGARTATLHPGAVTEARLAYRYRCIITDKYGSTITTNEVRLRLPDAALTITAQPTDCIGELGGTARFTVAAEGLGLSYQWQVNAGKGWQDSTASGSRTATLKAGTVTEARLKYRYRCIITDLTGSTITTDEVRVVPRTPVVFGLSDQYVGRDFIVTVEASGVNLTYAWYLKTAPDEPYRDTGVTTISYTMSYMGSEFRNGFHLYCVVTDDLGNSAESYPIRYNTDNWITIVTQPQSVEVARPGDKATVTVEAEGVGLTYAWMFHDRGINGFKASSVQQSTYSVSMTAARDGRELYCVIRDVNGAQVITNVVTISIRKQDSPTITCQPVNYVGAIGDTATFTVAAEGEGLRYQWQHNTGNGWSGWKDSGASGNGTDTLHIGVTEARLRYRYRCIVTDAQGNFVVTKEARMILG